MDKKKGCLVLYVTGAAAPGWMERQLMPSGSYSTILSQQVWYSDRDASKVIGSRLKTFNGSAAKPEPTKQWSPSDWMVQRIDRYDSPDPAAEYSAIALFHCVYHPVIREWKTVDQLEPASV